MAKVSASVRDSIEAAHAEDFEGCLSLAEFVITLHEEAKDCLLALLGDHEGDFFWLLPSYLIITVPLDVDGNVFKRVFVLLPHVDVVLSDHNVCNCQGVLDQRRVTHRFVISINYLGLSDGLNLKGFFRREALLTDE